MLLAQTLESVDPPPTAILLPLMCDLLLQWELLLACTKACWVIVQETTSSCAVSTA